MSAVWQHRIHLRRAPRNTPSDTLTVGDLRLQLLFDRWAALSQEVQQQIMRLLERDSLNAW
ncbi:MAG: hypothetical protein VB877_19475 [Pirellulaceae bacterium]